MKTFNIFLVILFLAMTSNLMGFTWGGEKTLKELANLAPHIVVGKVLDVTCQTGKYLEQDDFIFTYVKLSVQTSLKGDTLAQILTLKIPGGQIGDRVIGGERSFRFSKGEKVLLFLRPTDKNYYEIYSISGKLSVAKSVDDEYFDCSLLKEDEISKYGYGSKIKTENIINRIKEYIAEKGAESK